VTTWGRTPTPSEVALERLVRDEWSQVVGVLVRDVGDLALAEDSVQDAVTKALTTWPVTGVPDRPGAWITVTARRQALDRLRRQARFAEKAAALAAEMARAEADPTSERAQPLGDEQLELIFACCHPSLATEAQVALTLRAVAGLSTTAIARAFVVPEATMAQRLVRAKRKLRGAGIPFAVPAPDVLPERLDEVLAVVYLVFNEGYSATAGDRFVRADLCEEAIRLARLLHRLLPDEDEVQGLLALLLLTDARRPARVDADGHLVLLEQQDRSQWDRQAIAEGAALLAEAWRRGPAGPYSIQAAIALEHDQAPVAAATDWDRIAELYTLLAGLTGSVVVELNRAVAVSMADGPGAGLALVDPLGDSLDGYLPYHATRGDLLRRLGRHGEAHEAFERAHAMAATDPERAFFAQRLAQTAPRADVPGSGGDPAP